MDMLKLSTFRKERAYNNFKKSTNTVQAKTIIDKRVLTLDLIYAM